MKSTRSTLRHIDSGWVLLLRHTEPIWDTSRQAETKISCLPIIWLLLPMILHQLRFCCFCFIWCLYAASNSDVASNSAVPCNAIVTTSIVDFTFCSNFFCCYSSFVTSTYNAFDSTSFIATCASIETLTSIVAFTPVKLLSTSYFSILLLLAITSISGCCCL